MRELRSDLAARLRRAEAGEQLLVTVGGRVVAQLGPLEPAGGAPATLEHLIASGQLIAPRRSDPPRPTSPIPAYAGVRLDRQLRELRG